MGCAASVSLFLPAVICAMAAILNIISFWIVMVLRTTILGQRLPYRLHSSVVHVVIIAVNSNLRKT